MLKDFLALCENPGPPCHNLVCSNMAGNSMCDKKILFAELIQNQQINQLQLNANIFGAFSDLIHVHIY